MPSFRVHFKMCAQFLTGAISEEPNPTVDTGQINDYICYHVPFIWFAFQSLDVKFALRINYKI